MKTTTILLFAGLFALQAQTIRTRSTGAITTTVSQSAFVSETDRWVASQKRPSSGALIASVYQTVFSIALPGTPDSIWKAPVGKKIRPEDDDVQLGDVFFYRVQGKVSHAAIYIDNEDGFINVSPEQGVFRAPVESLTYECIGIKRFVEWPETITLRAASAEIVASASSAMDFVTEVNGWFGTPYVWGAAKKKQGSDCSGFVTSVYQSVFGIGLPRSSSEIWTNGGGQTLGKELEDLQVGDILFFADGGRVNHVAVYYGERKIAHAKYPGEPLGTDVFYGSGSNPYYMPRYVGAKRFVRLSDSKSIAAKPTESKTTTKTEAKPAAGVLETLTGSASYYADQFHGRLTANEEVFDMNGFTCAHRTYAFNTIIRVTDPSNGQSVVVRVNDRGPFVKGRLIDLSLGAAKKLDMIRRGIADVKLEVLTIGDNKIHRDGANEEAIAAFNKNYHGGESSTTPPKTTVTASTGGVSGKPKDRTLYRSTQSNVRQVKLEFRDKMARAVWTFSNGDQEDATGKLLTGTASAEYQNYTRNDPGARAYGYQYQWNDENYKAALVVAGDASWVTEIDENLSTGAIKIYQWTQ